MAVTPETCALPTSFAQELLWHLDRATPGMTAYNSPRVRRLVGPLDVEALRRALDGLIARHEILRTYYAERDGAVVQMVRSVSAGALPLTDLSGLPDAARTDEARRLLQAESLAAFDLAQEPPFRGRLFRMGPEDHLLIIATHHIATDGWSGGIMMRELFQLYEGFRAGTPVALPELPIQYGDFAAWQREQMSGPRLDELMEYWRTQLQGPLPVLELPTDRPRPRLAGFEGGLVRSPLASELVEGLRRVGQRHGASLYMVLLAAYQSLLARWSGQDDIMVGAPVAGRDRADLENLIGFVANTMVYRTRLGDDPTFDTLLTRVRDTCLGAYEHQDIPLEKLVTDLKEQEHLADGSLFRVVFTMLDDTPAAQEAGSLRLEPFGGASESAKFDLVLFLSDRPGAVQLALNYSGDLFEESTARRFLGHLETLLAEVVRDSARPLSTLPILTLPERAALIGWNDTATDLGPATTIASLIQSAGLRVPGATAVVSGGIRVTWAELLERANQLAHHLQSLGAGPEVPVGLCFDRSADLIVGMTGILASGGAYVPLLPDIPPARLAVQCAESGVRVVVTDVAHAKLVPRGVAAVRLDADAALLAKLPTSAPVSAATANSLAYVLFTSGSTGVPKGVAVTHGNLVHYTRAISRVLQLDLAGGAPAWQFGTVSTLGADLGHTAVFPALCSGGTLHVLPSDVIVDAVKFQACLVEHPLDVLKITPSHLRALVGPEMAQQHLPTRWLVLGGEACPWDLVEQALVQGRCRVLNHYGPTETTVGACTLTLDDPALCRRTTPTVPIGRPLPNVTAHVLEPSGQPAPVGVPGELFIGGAGVARGYLHRDELTRDRFAVRGAERVYRTGDRVRRLASGEIEFLGRFDSQVKIRGNRVELGEIEAVLGAHPAVAQAVVVLRDETLVAYVVQRETVTDSALAAHAGAAVPDYMVPDVWVRLAQIPLTANGKVNRDALPSPHAAEPREAEAPRGETEQRLVTLWSEVLKRDSIGRDANFFAQGGHSLLAIRLLGRIARQFGVRLPLRTLFEHPTIEGLAARLDLESRLASVESLSDEEAERLLASERAGDPSA